MEKTSNTTVMFADFVGSTRLYERFGDERANAIIAGVIESMSAVVLEHRGDVIKTIGDELMCGFADANDAVNAACQIQQRVDAMPTVDGFRIAVRIGMHSGEILRTAEGDLYGDTVNVAARIAGLVRARQILVSAAIIDQLKPDMLLRTRLFDVLSVKGKANRLALHQIVWEANDVTLLASNMALIEDASCGCLTLQYDVSAFHITIDAPCIMIGREALCDLIIESSYVSRFHARIEFRRGRYVLVDQSTNGTFIRFEDEQDFYVRGEEITLLGKGIISIGKTIDTDDALHVLRFQIA